MCTAWLVPDVTYSLHRACGINRVCKGCHVPFGTNAWASEVARGSVALSHAFGDYCQLPEGPPACKHSWAVMVRRGRNAHLRLPEERGSGVCPGWVIPPIHAMLW